MNPAMNSIRDVCSVIYSEGSFEHMAKCKFACVSSSYALYDNAGGSKGKNGRAAIVM
jgi:hypothetical protein